MMKKEEEEEAIQKLTRRPRKMNRPSRMPMRGERRAPKFIGKAEELPRFFSDVENLAEEAELDDEEMVKWACRYVESVAEEETWKTARAYGSAKYTWEDFKKEIFQMYPGSDGEYKYRRADLLRIVAERSRREIESRREFGEFEREFRRVAGFLESKGRISRGESERAYLSAFTGKVRERMDFRLMLKDMDHHPDDPYPLEMVRECANYVLREMELSQQQVESYSDERGHYMRTAERRP